MVVSKQFLLNYILKTPLLGEYIHLHGPLLEVVINKFFNLASPNYMNHFQVIP